MTLGTSSKEATGRGRKADTSDFIVLWVYMMDYEALKGEFIVMICSQHKKKTFGDKRRLK